MVDSENAKIIVFDLDGTLGYFSQISVVWEFLKHRCVIDPLDVVPLFNAVFDLFPEIIRPNMSTILKYVYKQKCEQCCDQIMIYTNNKKQKQWAEQIAAHFEELICPKVRCPLQTQKMSPPLFDQIIHAFKVNGEIVEFSRTTNKKTHGDFLSCTRMPENTQICFLDDCVHENMCNGNVYYIHFEPYVYHLQFGDMFARVLNNENDSIYIQGALSQFNGASAFLKATNALTNRISFEYVKKKFGDYEMDKIVSNNILEKLRSFFRICEDGNCGRFIKIRSTPSYSKKRKKKRKKGLNKTMKRKKSDD
jgi:hypothetical protein